MGSRLLGGLLAVLAPHECLVCKTEGSLLCPICAAGLPRLPARCYMCLRWSENWRTCKRCRSPLYGVSAVTPYEGVAKELLHALKFARSQAAASTIASILVEVCANLGDVVVTNIPTAPVRVRQRGYDQAALIARALAQRLNRPYMPLLVRLGSERQVGQQREVRKQQMAGAFRPLQQQQLLNKHILLVDDVLTTGATCEAAARVLKQAGAERVSAVVFAVA